MSRHEPLAAWMLLLVACGSSAEPAAKSSSPGSSSASVAVAPSSTASPSSAPPAPRALTSGISVTLTPAGIGIATARGAVGTGCAGSTGVTVPAQSGSVDLAVVKRCARTLKSAAPDETSVDIAASPGTAYRDVIALIDAVRTDERGELFTEVHFNPPVTPGAPAGAAPGAPSASSATSPPALVLSAAPNAPSAPPPPAAIPVGAASTSELPDEGVVVRISKTQIIVGDDSKPVAEYPNREELAATGLPARYKNAPGDYYVVSLADSLARYRASDVELQSAKGRPAGTSEAILVADEMTPYRLFYEVLFTLGQSEFGKYHLMARTGTKR